LNEFGEVKDKQLFYAYMNNCGSPLNNILTISINNINIIKLIKIILLQCLNALKLVHNLNYLHLDIKSTNFLYTINNNNLDTLQIKIIDFGRTTKNNLVVGDWFGTVNNIPNDWLVNWYSSKLDTQLKSHHDFFELGYTIFEIILLLFKQPIKFMCPIIENDGIEMSEEEIIYYRMNYNSTLHNEDANFIYNMFLKNNIDQYNANILRTIFYKLCNPNVDERFKSIDEILHNVNKINIIELSKDFPQRPRGYGIKGYKSKINKNSFSLNY
jgi:serine/threonine protein kinase